MQYDFSAHFLKIVEPDTSFDQAWESLCAILLREEYGVADVLRFSAPDTGVDILHRSACDAYQCKSSVHGALATIPSAPSIQSLRRASGCRNKLPWSRYLFATNAPYSGVATTRILDAAKKAEIAADNVLFRGPDYWDRLCVTHAASIEDRFDYKVSLAEKRLVGALRSLEGADCLGLAELEQLIRAATAYYELTVGGPRRPTPSAGLPPQLGTTEVRNNLTELAITVPVLPNMNADDLLRLILNLLDLPLGDRRSGVSVEADWFRVSLDADGKRGPASA